MSTKWKCLNDNFSYCTGTPDCDKQPKVVGELVFMGGTCKLDYKTCGKHQTFSSNLPSINLAKSSYRHTVVGKKKAKKGGKK